MLRERLLVVIIAMSLAGCSTISRGLSSTEHENLPVFAEQTVTLFGIHNIEFRASGAELTRDFTTNDNPDIAHLEDLIDTADSLRDGLIKYTLVIVRIGKSTEEVDVKVTMLADSIIRREIRENLERIGSRTEADIYLESRLPVHGIRHEKAGRMV